MFKKPLNIALKLFLMILFSTTSYAATDETIIDLSYNYTPYVNFTGTAAGASRFYDNGQLANGFTTVWVNLGTLGLESNVPGNCDLSFSTNNNFTLLNTSSTGGNLGGGSLGAYSLRYRNQIFGNAANPSNINTTLPCTSLATPIDFKLNRNFSFVGFNQAIRAGVYQDIVNIVVTTQ